MWLPLINYFLFFYWFLYFPKKYNISKKEFWVTSIQIFGTSILIGIPNIILNSLNNQLLNSILLVICLYLYPLLWGVLILKTVQKY